MSSRPARPRRIDDALSQLVDSLTPPHPLTTSGEYLNEDAAEALAASEEQRHRQNLDRAWLTIDSRPNASSPAGLGLGAENFNNASDVIKRKLLSENSSPEKAVRFSNLYSRLLTQPVLSQKWAIMYLLYRLSGPTGGDGRSRSPLMDEGGLQNMLMRGRNGAEREEESSEDEGPAPGSSASQRLSFRQDWEDSEGEFGGSLTQRPMENMPSRAPVNADGSDRTPAPEEQQKVPSPQKTSWNAQKLTVPSERGLLRDLPYNLQGLSSSNLEFASSSVLSLPPSLPIPIISLLNTLAEPCLLYRGLSDFVESAEGGLVSQSLQSALTNELRSYLGLVATLEGEIRSALAAASGAGGPKSVSKSGVTLKRCVVWTRDATMALRLMSLIVEESRSKWPGISRWIR